MKFWLVSFFLNSLLEECNFWKHGELLNTFSQVLLGLLQFALQSLELKINFVGISFVFESSLKFFYWESCAQGILEV